MAGYLGRYLPRGSGKGKMNAILYEANNIAIEVARMSLFLPGLTAQSAINHLLEHVMQHEFFHLIFESTIFRVGAINGRNAAKSANRYDIRNRVEGNGGVQILRLEESAANAFAVHSHSISMESEQRNGFLRWLRTGGIGYGEFESVLDSSGVTQACIEELVKLVFAEDSHSLAYDLYLEEVDSLQPLFSEVSLLINPVDPEENDYAPFCFQVGKKRTYPPQFYDITWNWVEEQFQNTLLNPPNLAAADYINTVRNTPIVPEGERYGSVIAHSLPDCEKTALFMDDENQLGWICLLILDNSLFEETLSEVRI